MLSSGLFSFDRVCFATSWVDFQSAECVLPCLVSLSGQQSVFCHVPGQFPNGRVHSATSRFPVSRVCSSMSRVNYRSSQCVPPHSRSISGWQSVFRHVLGTFPLGRVCSPISLVQFLIGTLCSTKYWVNFPSPAIPDIPN